MRIDTETHLYGVIGDPIGHSLSPLMQNWFIRRFDLNALYMAFHVKDKNVSSCFDGVRAMGIHGLNVTIPHKEAVLNYVDEKSDAVRLLKAANTIANVDGSLTAYVTDPDGFIASLGDRKERFKAAGVLMFGAGGAAKSVAYAADQLKIDTLIIHDVIPEKSAQLVNTCQTEYDYKAFDLSSLRQDSGTIVGDSNIVINATAVGMFPNHHQSVLNDYSRVSDQHFFYDLVYNPSATLFLQRAEQSGAAVQNGLRMLIYQGLQSLRIWYDQDFELTESQVLELEQLMTKQLESHE